MGGELEAERTLLESELASAAAAREESAVRWQQGEESLRELQARSDGLRRELASLEVRHAEARGVLQSSRARAAEEFDVDLTDLVARLAEEDRIEHELVGGHGVQLDRAALLAAGAAARPRAAARTLAGRIERLGPVNLAADEEFREVDTRWTEFVTQREDLEAALADLKKAIFQIEKETRERFTEAFEAVSAGFSALYPRLVGGGRAELTLTEPKAPLRTGIEILVEPPGKRPQSLGLLSGGEKAMAALALVFAVFQVKPSPFCLLDEVDASLDDANSRRFNGMLREMASETQFIVVTHNRTTMEVADRLYGVTMQKPGVSSVVSVRL